MADTIQLSSDELVLDRSRYADVRKRERARMIAVRRARRVPLGDRIALEFESAETLLYQAQEMMYVEGVTDPRVADADLDSYRRLLPGTTSLTATLLIELADAAAVRDELVRLQGVQHSVWLRAGEASARGKEIPGPDEDGPSEATASVHFLRFAVDGGLADGLRSGGVAVVASVEHPAYSASTELTAEQRRLLVEQLDSSA